MSSSAATRFSDAPGTATVDVGHVLDEAQWSGFGKGVLVLVSLVIVLDGLDSQTLTLAIPSIMREWGIGRGPFGPLLALGFVAMAIGTGLGGMLGDRLGRRGALLGSTAVFGLGTLAGALTHDIWWLGVTRIVASVGLGSAMPNATALVAEYTPRRNRSLALGIAMGSQPVGTFIGGLIAAAVLSGSSWEMLFVVTGIIPLLCGVALLFLLPESIRFLLNRGGANPRIAALLARLGHPAAPGAVFVDRGEERARRASLGELFTPLHRRDTLVLSGAFFLVICSNLFTLAWTPSLLASLGYTPGSTSAAIATFSIGGLFGAVGGAALFGLIGSRWSLSLMIGGAVAVMLVIASSPFGPGGLGMTTLLALLFVAGAFIPGSQVLLFSLAGQAYPTAIRATGVGFAAAVGRIGAVVSGLAGPFLIPLGPPGFFGAIALVMAASAVLLLFTRTVIQPSHRGELPAGTSLHPL